MALRRTAAHRFVSRILNSQIRSPGAPSAVRRHERRPIFLPSDVPSARRLLPGGDHELLDTIRSLNSLRDRIRLDVLPPPPVHSFLPAASPEEKSFSGGISVEQTKKLLRASQMEAIKSRLRGIPRSCIAYSEFLSICCDESIARSLDESGSVIVLGDLVFTRPEEVVGALEKVIPSLVVTDNDKHRAEEVEDEMMKELKELSEMKKEIDKEAEGGVRRELWWGLGLLAAQTAGFMRLTFWELSWDVMEPVCFFITSIYFMAGYAFFLRTSRDPSFEGFFSTRFAAKQRRIMRARAFDLARFNHLNRTADASGATSRRRPSTLRYSLSPATSNSASSSSSPPRS